MFFKQFIFKVIFVYSYSFCCSAVDASLLASFHNAAGWCYAKLPRKETTHLTPQWTLPAIIPDLKTGCAHWWTSGMITMGVINHFHSTGGNSSLVLPTCSKALECRDAGMSYHAWFSRWNSSLISFVMLKSCFGLVWDRISFSRLSWNSWQFLALELQVWVTIELLPG